MNRDVIEGKWDQAKGAFRKKWGALTDGDISRMNGERDKTFGMLQEKYGWTREQAERELTDLRDDRR